MLQNVKVEIIIVIFNCQIGFDGLCSQKQQNMLLAIFIYFLNYANFCKKSTHFN